MILKLLGAYALFVTAIWAQHPGDLAESRRERELEERAHRLTTAEGVAQEIYKELKKSPQFGLCEIKAEFMPHLGRGETGASLKVWVNLPKVGTIDLEIDTDENTEILIRDHDYLIQTFAHGPCAHLNCSARRETSIRLIENLKRPGGARLLFTEISGHTQNIDWSARRIECAR